MLELNKIYCGDCLELMKELPDKSMDLVLTDPPYGLSFMGKDWDHGIPGVCFWQDMLRISKPGAHLLAFGGTRTHHRLMVAIEDAGWEIRDTLMWVYGSGFPKSLGVSKALDKAAGVEREVIGVNNNGSGANLTKLANHEKGDTGIGYMDGSGKTFDITAPATAAAKEWDGWGTALKPAWEPIILARKPLDGTVAQNVLKWGVGGINIDGCRVEYENTQDPATNPKYRLLNNYKTRVEGDNKIGSTSFTKTKMEANIKGRFPANLIHDGSDEVVELFPQSNGAAAPVLRGQDGRSRGVFGNYAQKGDDGETFYNDKGSAARFFYCAKASRSERGEDNTHPTVKPLALIEYLLKLASPEDATILDPFMGSGTTCVACKKLGRNYIGIDKEPAYVEIARKRIERVNNHKLTDFWETGWV